MANNKYPKDVPVDEPVAPRKATKMPMGKMVPKSKTRPMYQDSVPVDEPVSPAMPKPAPQPPMYPNSVPVDEPTGTGMKRGGKVKKMASGGYTRAADGIAQRGKTRAQQFCDGGMPRGRK